MGADSLSQMSWLFGLYDKVVDFLIVATAPLMTAVGQAVSSVIGGVSYLALIILLFSFLKADPLKSTFVTVVIFLVITVGIQPKKITLTGGSTVQATNAQWLGYTAVMSVNKVLSSAITSAASSLQTDGAFIPTAALIDYSVERTANQYKNSDVGRLIRDYNAQCSPAPDQVVKGKTQATVADYHAIGLLGGSGLGIPEEQISKLSQIKVAGSGVVAIFSAMTPWSTSTNAGDAANKVIDIGAARSRRANGLLALENINQPFVSSQAYKLPTAEYWVGLTSGKSDAKPTYMSLADAPSDIRESLEKNVGSWNPEEGGRSASLSYNPTNCVEAYKVAQFAAEQAYKGLVETGDMKASGGQSASTEAGMLSAARSWMRVQQATFAGGEDKQPGALNSVVSGTIASWQGVKSLLQWFDLQTLLPLYVAGMGGLFWLALMSTPLALLMLPIRGAQGLSIWSSLMIFPMLCVFFVQLIAVAASFSLKAIALVQAALAAGWQGGGADLDLVYGAMQMLFGVLLPAGTWIAAKLTGVVISPLGAAARGSVVTGQEALKSTAQTAKFIAAKGMSAESSGGQGTSHHGSPGGGGGSGNGQRTTNQKMALSNSMRNSGSTQSSSSYSRSPSSAVRTALNLTPGRASNDDSAGKRRTPRSERSKKHPELGDE